MDRSSRCERERRGGDHEDRRRSARALLEVPGPWSSRLSAVALAALAVGCKPAEIDAKTKSHSFIDAFDRGDIATVRGMLAPTFQRFEQSRMQDARMLLGELEADGARVPRTWGEEHTSPGNGIFIGEASEKFPTETISFWNTLVWTREGKLALWQVERIPTAREQWNEEYRHSASFKKEPNQLLVDTVKDRKPGTALDVAMGQGRNAVFLASRGWKVTGVDISDEGVRIAKADAEKRQLPLEAIEADLATWDYGKDRWDLVTMIYAGADPADVEKIKRSLRSGGLVVIEVFHADGTGGTRSSGFATGQLARLFEDGYSILRDEVVDDISDWGGANKVRLVRFVAQKK